MRVGAPASDSLAKKEIGKDASAGRPRYCPDA